MHRPSTRSRGFVMVLVLLLVAVLTAVVVGQLGVVRTQRLTAIRDNDQVQARAIAERCLARARTYLDQYRTEKKPIDWDQVLDPNLDSHPTSSGGNNKVDDDFVPLASFGGSIVYVPSSESASSGLRQALHRWRLIDMDGGACLVRFDDNSDDFKAGGGQDNSLPTDKYENNGKDAPNRDRDMGIFVNAMGIFPKPSGTAAADAYDRARARVALKTFIGTGGSPGIVAHDAISVESNIALCGMGGLQSDKLNYVSGTTGFCTCGDTVTGSAPAADPTQCVTSTTPGSLCDPALPCNTGTVSTAPGPNPDVKVPTPVDWLELEGFQDPTNPKGLGDNGICEFYFRARTTTKSWQTAPTLDLNVSNPVATKYMSLHSDNGEVFVFDHTDNDAHGCKTNNSLATCSSSSPNNVVTHDCRDIADTTYMVAGKRIVKKPCAWNGGTGTNGPTVQCATPDTETPCWKLVSRVRGGGTTSTIVQQDFDNSAAADVWDKASPPGGTDTQEHSASSWTEVFAPKTSQRIPNIEFYWGDPKVVGSPPIVAANDATVGRDITASPTISDTWKEFCNTTTPCTGCGSGGFGLKISGGIDEHWHFEKAPMCRKDFITPSILVVENQAQDLTSTTSNAGRFHVRDEWGDGCADGLPVQHTVIVQGHAEIETNTKICGAFSDCTGFPVVGVDCNPADRPKAKGYVLRAGGSCYLGAGTTYVGDFACGNIHINASTSGACNNGNLVAFNDDAAFLPGEAVVCPDSSATSGYSPCTKGICIKDSVMMMGDIISDADICIRSGVTISGSVLGGGDGPDQGNIFIENNTVINGQLVSEGDIGMRSNVVINNNGNGVFGSRVTTGIRVETSY